MAKVTFTLVPGAATSPNIVVGTTDEVQFELNQNSQTAGAKLYLTSLDQGGSPSKIGVFQFPITEPQIRKLRANTYAVTAEFSGNTGSITMNVIYS